MSFGSRLLQASKKKGISHEKLAKHLGAKGPAISRNENKPSIKAATKKVHILEESLDWRVGLTDAELDTVTINQIQNIAQISLKIGNSSLSSSNLLFPIGKLKPPWGNRLKKTL